MATIKSKTDWARKTPPILSMDMYDRIDAIRILRDALTAAEEERDRAYNQGFHDAKIAAISAIRDHGYNRFNPLVAETESAVSRVQAALHTTETEGSDE